MKIGELDMHCGNCPLIDMCTEPYEFAVCESRILRNITTEQYKEEYVEWLLNRENKEVEE